MVKVKICGLQTTADIDAVNEALPEFVGFVFAKSKRQVTAEAVREMAEGLVPTIKKVGVFVNADIDQMLLDCKTARLDYIQLHGDETPDDIRRIRKKTDLPIIKAIRMRAPMTEADLNQYDADYFLFDVYSEKGYGGIGESFDLHLMEPFRGRNNIILAGGLSSDNIIEKLSQFTPFMIDVSSGVETDGMKDREKIKQIISLVQDGSQH